MKTDRFSDSIRRKLESIRPDFTEKDWTRMQDSLRHASPHGATPSGVAPVFQPVVSSAWSARPWLMAAAVSTIVLVSFAAWQRVQIANLRQTVNQLSRQQTMDSVRKTGPQNAVPLPSESAATRSAEVRTGPVESTADGISIASRQPDTVYVTRYVPVPAQTAGSTPGRVGRVAQQSAPDPVMQQPTSVPNPSTIGRTTPTVDRTRSLADARLQQRSVTGSAPSNQRDAVGNDVTTSVAVTSTNAEAPERAVPGNPDGRLTNRAKTRQPETSRNAESLAGRNRSSTTPVSPDPVFSNNQPTGADLSTDEKATAAAQPTATYELTTNRPLTAMTTDWSSALAHRVRALRPVRTTVVGGLAPASQPASPVAFGFRIGVGAEAMRDVLSGSVVSELLIGRHLTIGAGVGLASFAGGSFLTDEKFDQGKQNKPGRFRREYARGLDPRSDILNIGIRTERVQIPLTIGYRIPVSRTLSLLPSVGTVLNLQSRELVTFTFRQPFRSFEAANYQISRPVNLLNSLSFGAGVEWNRSHWVVQAGPTLTVPLVADANWQENTAIGLRARVFYQF